MKKTSLRLATSLLWPKMSVSSNTYWSHTYNAVWTPTLTTLVGRARENDKNRLFWFLQCFHERNKLIIVFCTVRMDHVQYFKYNYVNITHKNLRKSSSKFKRVNTGESSIDNNITITYNNIIRADIRYELWIFSQSSTFVVSGRWLAVVSTYYNLRLIQVLKTEILYIIFCAT